ncbi:MAG: hypothetical protein V1829_00085 [bacterium]
MKIKKQRKYFYLLIIAFLICAGFVFCYIYKCFKQPVPAEDQLTNEKTMEEIIASLTAPTGAEKTEVSDEVIRSLTAPK